MEPSHIENTAPKPFCFVLMPFDRSFDDIYQLGIRAACDIAGAYCERVDEQLFDGMIIDRVYNQISKADIIVADMTGKNANVFYEVGYAHALGKKTILLTNNVDDIPFDLKHYPHIIYDSSIILLKDQLVKKLNWAFQNPIEKFKEKLDIDIYIGKQNISSDNVEVKGTSGGEMRRGSLQISLTIQNSSLKTYLPGQFKVGIICNSLFSSTAFQIIKLPDGENSLHILDDFDTLFPSAFTSVNITFFLFLKLEEEIFTVRIFSENGAQDYFVKGIFEY